VHDQRGAIIAPPIDAVQMIQVYSTGTEPSQRSHVLTAPELRVVEPHQPMVLAGQEARWVERSRSREDRDHHYLTSFSRRGRDSAAAR
jgi:hypothetical protein